jgi:serine-type D-Ala-D-Ala carboxypeptidase/endopeptidase
MIPGAIGRRRRMGATSALSGEFTWRCAHGRLTGSVLIAPTKPPRIQEIKLARKTP